MAYDPILDSDIQAGKAAKEEIFTKIKANQESFNTDIEALKQTSTIDIFNLVFSGKVNQYSASELSGLIPVFKAPVSGTFTSFVMTLLEASTSGTLEAHIDKSTDNGVNWTPLLTTSVKLTGTTIGSISGSVSWVDVPSQSFDQNDLVRIRFTGLQVDQGNFHLSVYGEVSG